MSLFSTVFSFHLPIFGKIHPASRKFARKSPQRIPEKIIDLSMKSADKSPKPAEFWYSGFLLFLRHLQCVSAKFSRISLIFSEFSENRWNLSCLNFLLPPNFLALVGHRPMPP
jgi:hypothetical protein